MIELIVDSKVLPQLRKAFPTPPGRAERALNNYVSRLRDMLIKSLSRGQTPLEAKANLFSLSLHELANKGGQIGEKKVRVHAWLRDNGFALVEPAVIGTNLTGMVSKVKFTDLVMLEWHEPEVDTNSTVVDGVSVTTQLLQNSEQLNKEIFDLLYPDYGVCIADHRFDEVFDVVDIDIGSLRNYIEWLQSAARHFTATKRNHYLFQARLILAVALHTGGKYYQRKFLSDFGRTYYKGTSAQNVNKDLRHAMLGDCWEYDIRSSVVAWKMGFAAAYIAKNAPKSSVAKTFGFTEVYLRDKAAFMKNVRQNVFEQDCDLPEELQLKMLKKAFTALSFGARKSSKGWINKNGEWENPSIVDIFQRADERDRFLNDVHVCGFTAEQTQLDDFLYDGVVKKYPDLLRLPYLQTQSGRPSKSKVIAYMYQHEETEVMDVVREALRDFGKTVLANIHDAIVVRHHLNAGDKYDIELRMRARTNNPYWSLGATEVKRWAASTKEAEKAEELHRQRIAAEEALAAGYVSSWAATACNMDPDE